MNRNDPITNFHLFPALACGLALGLLGIAIEACSTRASAPVVSQLPQRQEVTVDPGGTGPGGPRKPGKEGAVPDAAPGSVGVSPGTPGAGDDREDKGRDVAAGGSPEGSPRASAKGGSAPGGKKEDEVVPPGAEEAVKVFPMKRGQWRMWGGNPSRNMVNSIETNIPHKWNLETGENIKWKADLGSQSYGNPVIAEGRILIGTNNEGKRNPKITGDKGVIMCFRESDGSFIWQTTHDKLTAGRVNDWPEQGICSTPVVENGMFYYVSNRCELVCADLDGLADGNDGPYEDEKYTDPIDGDFVWIYDMMEELGVFPHNLATSSPLIVNDLVLIVTSNGVERDHITVPSPRSPSFLALDKQTGKLVWESADPGENILHGQWSCPAYGVAGGRPQVVFPGGDGWLYSYQPATGKLIWKFDCNPKDAKWELGGLGTRNNLLSTPVFYGDSVYIAVGQDPDHGMGIGHLYKVRADGQGDVTSKKQAWHIGGEDFFRTMSSVAVHEGLVFAADLTGYMYCLDEKTGKQLWIHDMLAAVWGSPTVIDGKVYLGDSDGDVLVTRAARKKEVLAENSLEGPVYMTPVAVNGVLYITTGNRLHAISRRK